MVSSIFVLREQFSEKCTWVRTSEIPEPVWYLGPLWPVVKALNVLSDVIRSESYYSLSSTPLCCFVI